MQQKLTDTKSITLFTVLKRAMEVSNWSKVTQMVNCKALTLLHLSYGPPTTVLTFFNVNDINVSEKVYAECLLHALCWAGHISYIREILQSIYIFFFTKEIAI